MVDESASNRISEHRVPLAAEDKFFVVSIRDAPVKCPDDLDSEVFAEAIELAKPYLGDLVPVFDLRGLPQVYSDVEQFLAPLASQNAQFLLDAGTADGLDVRRLTSMGMQPLFVKDSLFSPRSFDLQELRGIRDPVHETDPLASVAANLMFNGFNETGIDVPDVGDLHDPYAPFTPFEESGLSFPSIEKAFSVQNVSVEVAEILGDELKCGVKSGEIAKSLQHFLPRLHATFEGTRQLFGFPDNIDAVAYFLRAGLLHAFLLSLHRQSLMVEFVMTSNAGEITCAPYHSNALNEVAFPNSQDLLLGRAGVFASKTNAVFHSEIGEFQRILNSPKPKESQIQQFLEKHPHFLQGLNYSSVYPQLVLERDNGTSLRPDFLLEPFDDGWCDILDVKLPTHSVTVGRKDRKTLAAGIHEVAAQLREYAAYFENPKYRKWVTDKYGIRVYRPRLIAVVGRDFRNSNEVDIRRAMTCYDNLQIMTFDELIRHASHRILI